MTAFSPFLLLWLAGGLALGLAHFLGLRANLALWLGGSGGAALLVLLGRLGLTAGLLVLAALQGAWPLLAMAAGLLLARPLALRLAGG